MIENPRFVPALKNLPLVHQGKTRDTFATKSLRNLLVVATQRLSTHNVIHRSEVPFKDQVLTALTVFWATNTLSPNQIRHHVVAHGRKIYDFLPGSPSDYPDDLHYRAIVVQKLTMVPVEFIYRSYLTGSLYKEYYSKQLPNPYRIHLPEGLKKMSPFTSPIFTPTEKSENDDPIDSAMTRSMFSSASDISEKVFYLTQLRLRHVGLELVDSKLEIGYDGTGRVVVADEIVTPDSSRFVEHSSIKLGEEPPWLDKQIARDEAERIWNGGPKAPLTFLPDVVSKVSSTYLSIFRRITGMELGVFKKCHLDD